MGGLEVIGYDPATGQFRPYFFDHTGNAITETLTCKDGTWSWQAANHRCRGWEPSMIVTLRKVE